MKRLYITILALVLLLSLCACQNETPLFEKEFTFPENTVIAGVDVADLTRDEAWSKLEEAAAGYVLNLNVDGNEVSISAKDMGLSCSKKDFMAAADAMEAGTQADASRVIRFQDAKLRLALTRMLNYPAQDAALIFDETAKEYVLQPHAEGLRTDYSALAVSLKETIRTLTPQQALTGYTEVLSPARRTDSGDVQTALARANALASVELSYVFGAESSAPIIQTVPGDIIRSFIVMGEDGFSPDLDKEAIAVYAEELAATYSTQPRLDSFLATDGEELDMLLPFEGCTVDTEALAQDIALCLSDGISGARPAPYLGNGNSDLPYGGTYIEVDLTAQHLWFYKEGTCLVDTDLVSGCVELNMHTPTGNFYIYSKTRGTYLEGPGYKSWVSYWMPFTGGYGLHDAQWRDEFGGDIYLDDGSHGCVNLPWEAAGTIFDNAPRGTRVILHGGEGSVEPREQEINCVTEYTVTADAAPFNLKARSANAWPDFFYETDNPAVATVAADGTVTIQGEGSANITVIAVTEGRYDYAKTTVSITVTPPEAAEAE